MASTKYNVSVSGKANTPGEKLALSVVSAPRSCPANYSAGFASLSGPANSKGKTRRFHTSPGC